MDRMAKLHSCIEHFIVVTTKRGLFAEYDLESQQDQVRVDCRPKNAEMLPSQQGKVLTGVESGSA
jgi:hypothetical protein